MLPADIDWHFHTTSLVRFCVIVKTREIVINSLPVTSSIGHKMRQKKPFCVIYKPNFANNQLIFKIILLFIILKIL